MVDGERGRARRDFGGIAGADGAQAAGRSLVILSVLDQTPIAAGTSPAAALANSIDLARHCEALGYHRYWLAEHHASPALAGSAPEILIAAVAAATRTMRWLWIEAKAWVMMRG